jgi:hypothetical protein
MAAHGQVGLSLFFSSPLLLFSSFSDLLLISSLPVRWWSGAEQQLSSSLGSVVDFAAVQAW